LLAFADTSTNESRPVITTQAKWIERWNDTFASQDCGPTWHDWSLNTVTGARDTRATAPLKSCMGMCERMPLVPSL